MTRVELPWSKFQLKGLLQEGNFKGWKSLTKDHIRAEAFNFCNQGGKILGIRWKGFIENDIKSMFLCFGYRGLQNPGGVECIFREHGNRFDLSFFLQHLKVEVTFIVGIIQLRNRIFVAPLKKPLVAGTDHDHWNFVLFCYGRSSKRKETPKRADEDMNLVIGDQFLKELLRGRLVAFIIINDEPDRKFFIIFFNEYTSAFVQQRGPRFSQFL